MKQLEQQIRHLYRQAEQKKNSPPPTASPTQEDRDRGYQVLDEFFPDKNNSEKSICINCHPNNSPDSVFPHKHIFFEMNYICSGQMYVQAGEEKIVLNSGDLLILNPSVIHTVTASENALCLNILLRRELFQNACVGLLLNQDPLTGFWGNSLKENSDTKNFLYFPGTFVNQEQMESCLSLLLQEYTRTDSYAAQNIQSLISCICAELARANDKKLQSSDGCVSIENIIRYISANFQTASLESTAEHFGYHPKYLSSLLSRQYGKSFSEIRKLSRLHYAAVLLLKTELPVNEIITKCGYANSSYFYRIFEQNFGVSPTQYRREKPVGYFFAQAGEKE